MSGRIFGVGLSKTGTTSLYAALDVLGYRAATFRHMRKLRLDSWRRGDFEPDYLAEYDAVTDLPIAFYFRELDRRYPESKFILTTRDPESWLNSVERQFTANPEPGRFNRDTRLITYGFSGFNREAYLRRFEQHNDEVRSYFDANRHKLLEISFFEGAGWREICDFLGRPIPDVPFPNVKPGYRSDAD